MASTTKFHQAPKSRVGSEGDGLGHIERRIQLIDPAGLGIVGPGGEGSKVGGGPRSVGVPVRTPGEYEVGRSEEPATMVRRNRGIVTLTGATKNGGGLSASGESKGEDGKATGGRKWCDFHGNEVGPRAGESREGLNKTYFPLNRIAASHKTDTGRILHE